MELVGKSMEESIIDELQNGSTRGCLRWID